MATRTRMQRAAEGHPTVVALPWALGHLYLQVLILVGVAGAVASVVGAEAGAAHFAEERSTLLPPQPARDSCWAGAASTALGGP